uniref:Uncharacterized protein n=1 Tax=Anguilla anguilla TaxID=7936 RepID=A0A0E9VG59_ANGAN
MSPLEKGRFAFDGSCCHSAKIECSCHMTRSLICPTGTCVESRNFPIGKRPWHSVIGHSATT